jgi:hypothetical protein
MGVSAGDVFMGVAPCVREPAAFETLSLLPVNLIRDPCEGGVLSDF